MNGCTPGYSGDPTSAAPISAGCQNNQIIQTPKLIQGISHLSPEVLEHKTHFLLHPSKLLLHQISLDYGGSNKVGTRTVLNLQMGWAQLSA
ncbi:hypothetical protein AVEN_143263-1 [Araneus ventricosus]|uniref:Uncharacterized protein n=1 Tax=Araneus ventricosus TaxID=182803 RepID=A0A4Y2ADL6_ARAVE|nr:hypothetical protein AVEN_143263-1 [Araneus ventricosus]